MESNKRYMNVDIMKGILILSVVLGHSQSPGYRFIYLFHMSVFFMISGYLWNDKYVENKKNLLNMVKRKVHSLYRPFVLCNLFFLFLSIIMPKLFWHDYETGAGAITYLIKNIIKIFLLRGRTILSDTTWFLSVLFFISIIYGVLLYVGRKIKNQILLRILISFTALVIGGIFSYYKFNVWEIGTMFSSLSVFSFGNIIKMKEKQQARKNVSILVALLSFVGLLILLLINKQEIRLIENQYPNIFYFGIAAILGYIFIKQCSLLLIKNNFLKKMFIVLGKKSLYIMCIHMFAFKLVILVQSIVYKQSGDILSMYPTYDSSLGWWMVYTFVGVVVPLLYVFLYKKVRILLFDGVWNNEAKC